MRVNQLTDSGLNMVVGQITAPDDWQVSEQVQWSSFGNYPGMTQLSAVSPDGQRSFQLISTMSYFQTDSIFSSLGENETDPTTYRIHRQYRTAEQFVEMMLSSIGCTGAQKLSSSSIDSQSLSALKSTAEQHAYQTGYSLVQSLANLGMSANLVGYESTVVDNRYAVTTQSGQTEYIEKSGDVITKIGDAKTSDIATLQEVLDQHKLGSRVSVTYYHHGQRQTATVKLTLESDGQN